MHRNTFHQLPFTAFQYVLFVTLAIQKIFISFMQQLLLFSNDLKIVLSCFIDYINTLTITSHSGSFPLHIAVSVQQALRNFILRYICEKNFP